MEDDGKMFGFDRASVAPYGSWRVPEMEVFPRLESQWPVMSPAFLTSAELRPKPITLETEGIMFPYLWSFVGFYFTDKGSLVVTCNGFFSTSDISLVADKDDSEKFIQDMRDEDLWLYRANRPLTRKERARIARRINDAMDKGIFKKC